MDIARSCIKNADLRPCSRLVRVVRDRYQSVQVNTGVTVRALRDLFIPPPVLDLPVEATGQLHDTRDMYKVKIVSYGYGNSLELPDGS